MNTALQTLEAHLQNTLGQAVVGMQPVIRALTIAVVARGHVLLQGPPGLGKTLLSKSLATALGGTFRRVQGTADLQDPMGVGQRQRQGLGRDVHVALVRPDPTERAGCERQGFQIGDDAGCARRVFADQVEHGARRVGRDDRRTERRGVPPGSAAEVSTSPNRNRTTSSPGSNSFTRPSRTRATRHDSGGWSP